MFISLLVLSFIVIAIYVGSHKLNGVQTVGVLLIFVTGLTLVVVPPLAGNVAAAFGVGRGSDLILYLCVVAGLFVAANFYFRIKAQEEIIATLVREIAIMTPREPAMPRKTSDAIRGDTVQAGGAVSVPDL